MRTTRIATTAALAWLALIAHQLGTGLAHIGRYAALRTIDLAVQLARLLALAALAAAVWYLINPDAATTRLTALWQALRNLSP